ncbi:MAG: FkbM family methyltransferase [Dysgonamonadaceae bacterium]|jgi:FkbM family methyltransferase|nr:FkbM family methyltransferase [Dysgonamonadaceae bacterium]
MINFIKTLIYKFLSFENYLRVLQRSYFLLYRTGLLKFSHLYDYHYYVKNLIKKGDTVIDIGANLGYYSILFADWVGKQGKVYSVEPIQAYNKVFNEQAKKYTNITLYPNALGAEEKKVKLVISSSATCYNTGLPHVYDSQKDGDLNEQKFRFEAKMKRPSVLFQDLQQIDYIKCDIEGFEYTVLADMIELIERFKPIVQVEVWAENEEKLVALFKQSGYIPYKLYKNQLVEIEKLDKSIGGDYVFVHSINYEQTSRKI